jgi:hypothetical protein
MRYGRIALFIVMNPEETKYQGHLPFRNVNLIKRAVPGKVFATVWACMMNSRYTPYWHLDSDGSHPELYRNLIAAIYIARVRKIYSCPGKLIMERLRKFG